MINPPPQYEKLASEDGYLLGLANPSLAQHNHNQHQGIGGYSRQYPNDEESSIGLDNSTSVWSHSQSHSNSSGVPLMSDGDHLTQHSGSGPGAFRSRSADIERQGNNGQGSVGQGQRGDGNTQDDGKDTSKPPTVPQQPSFRSLLANVFGPNSNVFGPTPDRPLTEEEIEARRRVVFRYTARYPNHGGTQRTIALRKPTLSETLSQIPTYFPSLSHIPLDRISLHLALTNDSNKVVGSEGNEYNYNSENEEGFRWRWVRLSEESWVGYLKEEVRVLKVVVEESEGDRKMRRRRKQKVLIIVFGSIFVFLILLIMLIHAIAGLRKH